METQNVVTNSQGMSMEQCIRDCIACYQECTSCIPHCLNQGGKHAEANHISLMLECAELCNVSATMMQRKAQFAYELCQLCAKVCEACALSCRGIDANDSMMLKCADQCQRCADSCRRMSH